MGSKPVGIASVEELVENSLVLIRNLREQEGNPEASVSGNYRLEFSANDTSTQA